MVRCFHSYPSLRLIVDDFYWKLIYAHVKDICKSCKVPIECYRSLVQSCIPYQPQQCGTELGSTLLVRFLRPGRATSTQSPLVITSQSGLQLLSCHHKRPLESQASCLTPFAVMGGPKLSCQFRVGSLSMG